MGCGNIDLYDCAVSVCDSSKAPLMTLMLQFRGLGALHIDIS